MFTVGPSSQLTSFREAMQSMWLRHSTFWQDRLRPRLILCSAAHGFRSVHRSRPSVSQLLVPLIQIREDLGHGYVGDVKRRPLTGE
jgi:hypothetical protein